VRQERLVLVNVLALRARRMSEGDVVNHAPRTRPQTDGRIPLRSVAITCSDISLH
jgi:hypothetical protein